MINILLNDTLQCFILIGMMYFGTKLINYYYNFYHIYRYLDYDQKLGYFKSNILINIISRNIVVKRLIVYYMIIPLIKINYLFIQIFITLLYSSNSLINFFCKKKSCDSVLREAVGE